VRFTTIVLLILLVYNEKLSCAEKPIGNVVKQTTEFGHILLTH